MADWRPMLNRREDGFPRIMGVVNVTPDSFHTDSRYVDTEQAVTVAIRMVEDGADWIDLGGESTRPGAKSVTLEEELSHTGPLGPTLDVGAWVKGARLAFRQATAAQARGMSYLFQVSTPASSY